MELRYTDPQTIVVLGHGDAFEERAYQRLVGVSCIGRQRRREVGNSAVEQLLGHCVRRPLICHVNIEMDMG